MTAPATTPEATVTLSIEIPESLHAELVAWATETERSIAEVIEDAIEGLKAEEAHDRATVAARKDEPRIPFAEVIAEMRERGEL